MKEELIAPCGMDCGLCVSYQCHRLQLEKKGYRRKTCPGCRPRGENCLHMGDRCETLKHGRVRFCFECGRYPCRRLRRLDARYRARYHMSMLENLDAIRAGGLEGFLERQRERWRCPDCGGTLCCHNGLCLECQLDVLRRDRRYRWGEQTEDPGRGKGE